LKKGLWTNYRRMNERNWAFFHMSNLILSRIERFDTCIVRTCLLGYLARLA
jgi:hypothetical protein